MNRKCVCCGSGNLITGVKLIDKWDNGEDHAQVSLDAEPTAWVFKGRERANIHGEVCDDCGHLQLFVFKRSGLRRAQETRRTQQTREAQETTDSADSAEKAERGYVICKNCKTSHRQEDCPKCGFHVA